MSAISVKSEETKATFRSSVVSLASQSKNALKNASPKEFTNWLYQQSNIIFSLIESQL